MQKHLETGHTWMEVDSVHATIERKLRDRQIFWPAEYTQVTNSARKHPKLYTVRTVNRTFFRGFSKIRQYKSMRPGTVAGDPQVVDLRALRNTPDRLISYKFTQSEQWQALPRRPAGRSRGVWSINKLYEQSLPTSTFKS